MREILLPSLRSHVPGVDEIEPKPTWHLPIHIYTDDGIDLDFGPLLLFDQALIDEASFDYICKSSRKDLKPLALSLRELGDNGYLRVGDFGSELKKHRATITSHVDRIMRDPLPLREPYIRGIDQYRLNLPQIEKVGGVKDLEILQIGFGMHLRLMKQFGYAEKSERQRLERLLSSSKQRWTLAEIDDVRSLIEPTITNLYQNFALGQIYGAPFLDVDYTTELYQILRHESVLAFDENIASEAKQISEAQHLFSCILPELRPASAKTMMAFLKSNAVVDFREFVTRAAEDGRSISDRDYRLLLIETLDADRRFDHIKDGLAWGERFLSLFPVVGPAATAVSVFAEKVAHRKTVKEREWVYALIRASSIGRGK